MNTFFVARVRLAPDWQVAGSDVGIAADTSATSTASTTISTVVSTTDSLTTSPTAPGTAHDYVTLFHGYILRSLTALQQLITQAGGELPAAEREQAWHLLGYGLKLPTAWSLVRDLLLSLAPQMERAGFREEWRTYLVRGIHAAEQNHDLVTQAQLWLACGRLSRLRSDFAAAEQAFAQALTHAQGVQNTHLQAQAHNQLAYLARLQSRYPLAETHVNQALTRLAPDDPELATSYWVLGTVAQDQQDWEAALAHHQAALAIWQRLGNQQRTAWSLQNLGDTYRRMGNYPESITSIRQAIALLGEVDDPVNQAIARMGLGAVYEEMGRASEALALYHLAETVFRQVQDELHLAMVYNNQAIAYRDLEQWSAAEQAALQGVHYWTALGDAKSLANTLDELGLAYLGQGRAAEAAATFAQALQLLTQVPPGPIYEMLHAMILPHWQTAQAQAGEPIAEPIVEPTNGPAATGTIQ